MTVIIAPVVPQDEAATNAGPAPLTLKITRNLMISTLRHIRAPTEGKQRLGEDQDHTGKRASFVLLRDDMGEDECGI